MKPYPPVRKPVFRDGVWVIPPPRLIEKVERLLREDSRALTTDDWMVLLRGEEDGSRFIRQDYQPNS